MLSYALAVSTPGGPVPSAARALLADASLGEIPFVGQRHLMWESTTGHVAFAGWQSTGDDDPVGSRWHADAGGLTAFTGHLWHRGHPWRADRPWAEQLALHLRSHPGPDGLEDLIGIFTELSLDRNGFGALHADGLGLGVIHHGQAGGVVALSSRASLVALVLATAAERPIERDLTSTGLLAFSGRMVGTGTGYVGVEALPSRAWVTIGADGVQVHDPPSRWWDGAAGVEPEAAFEQLRADIDVTVQGALDVAVPHHIVGLTGGRDSRMVLAEILRLGLERDFEYRTWGADDLPDVNVARAIADAFSLHHGVNVAGPEAAAWRSTRDQRVGVEDSFEHGAREASMRLAVGGHLGMWNVVEQRVVCPPHSDRIVLSGLAGELLRTNFPGSTRLRGAEGAGRFLVNLQVGRAGILRDAVRAAYQEQVWELMVEGADDDDEPQDLIDAFYLRTWLRRWFGASREVDEENRVFPLASLAGVRGAFAMGVPARHSEWLHRRMISTVSDSLYGMPFAGSGWPDPASPSLRQVLRGRPRRGRAIPPTLAPPNPFAKAGSAPPERTAQRDLRRSQRSVDVALMRRYLVDDADNPIQALIDRTAVIELLDRFEDVTESAKRQLYGALSAAIWLGGHEITYRGRPADASSQTVGRAP